MSQNKFLRVLSAVVFVGGAFSVNLFADITVTGLFNTGVANDGTLLPSQAIDPHYTLTTAPSSPTGAGSVLVEATNVFPFGNWTGNTTTAQWVSQSPANGSTQPSGTYIYTTTFTVSGANPGSYGISGEWATDNEGLEIVLNGNALNIPSGVAPNQAFSANTFNQLYSFTLGNLQSGSNTLSFYVYNDVQDSGNPTGIIVDDLAAVPVASSTATPEPGLYGLVFAGLGSIAVAVRRRR